MKQLPTWEQLKTYIEVHQLLEWVFEGQNGGQYSERSVQEIFTRAKLRSMVRLGQDQKPD